MKNIFPKNTSKYQLIVSDFDGTLVGVNSITTSKVQKAIKKWIAAGKFFTIATGRQYLMIDDECKKMGITTPVIVRGGAEVVDATSGNVLHFEYISEKDVEEIVTSLNKSGYFYYGIEVDDTIYSNFESIISAEKLSLKKLKDFEIKSVPKFHLKPKNVDDVEKADIFVQELARSISRINVIATHNGKFGYGWDITSVTATKLHGVVKVMKMLSLERDQTVGVGDSYNDFPLLEAAGFKVAMGNANEELKEIADVIVPSNEEDGVAYLITKLLENSKPDTSIVK